MTSFLLAKPFFADAKLKQPKWPNGERTLQVAIPPYFSYLSAFLDSFQMGATRHNCW
jgi:hypothetical protein